MLANGGWDLTLILLTWTIWRAPTNASKWRMGFNPYPANAGQYGDLLKTLANGGWDLTLILLTWTIWRSPTNASKWRV